MLAVLNIALLTVTLFYTAYILWQIFSWIKEPVQSIISKEPETTVTLIIPCRNEEQNIARCIESILLLNYPTSLLEIVVADDHSDDKTREVAENVLKNSPFRWKYVQVSEQSSNKKKAIAKGIAASAGELIVITDGDCTVQKSWIRSIVSLYNEKNCQMICGPVALTNENNFCEKFQSLEVAGLSLLAGAGIFSNTPLLSNGANMAYTRKAFEKVNGFEGIDTTPTGDDTLLLFKMQKEFPCRIGYLKNYNSVVYTKAQPNWQKFIQQRIRWASKGFVSKNSLNSAISFLVFITNFLLLMYGIHSLVYFSINWVFINCLILKFTVDFLLLTCATSFLRNQWLLIHFLAGEFVTMVYVSWVGLVASFSHYSWKGRDY